VSSNSLNQVRDNCQVDLKDKITWAAHKVLVREITLSRDNRIIIREVAMSL